MKTYGVIFLFIVTFAVTGCAAVSPTPLPPTAAPTATRAGSPTPERPVELQVLPRTLRPGMRAVMVGVGFEKGEAVAFYLIRPDGTKTSEGVSTADTSGGAAYQVDVMDDWQPGQYVARVQSRKNPVRHAEKKIELQLR